MFLHIIIISEDNLTLKIGVMMLCITKIHYIYISYFYNQLNSALVSIR